MNELLQYGKFVQSEHEMHKNSVSWCCFGVFIVNNKHIRLINLLLILLTLSLFVW